MTASAVICVAFMLFAIPRLCAKTIGVVKPIGTGYCWDMDKDTLRTLAQANHRAAAKHDAAHEALVDAISEAADEGWQQVEIVRMVGLTRERARRPDLPSRRLPPPSGYAP